MKVLHRRGRRGLGRAYVAGFRRALEEGADVVVQMDADFSHPPDDVPRLLAALADYDVAIGSRYVSGGAASEDWSPGRRALSRWANLYSRTILGLKTRDATAGFKAWRRTALEAIDLGRIGSDGYVFQVEMAYLCERLGLRIGEIPITFEERHDRPLENDDGHQARFGRRRLPHTETSPRRPSAPLTGAGLPTGFAVPVLKPAVPVLQDRGREVSIGP